MSKQTALPDGRFDISNPASARGSLARASQSDVSPADKAAVRRAVKRQHPSIGSGSSPGGGFSRAAGEAAITREEEQGRGA